MTFLSCGSKTKNSATPRRLNMRQDLPPSWVMYAPVMSQATRTVLGSCGLTTGRNMAPPPPGPTIVKFPGRWANAAVIKVSARAKLKAKRVMSVLPSLLGSVEAFCQKGSRLSINISQILEIFPKLLDRMRAGRLVRKLQKSNRVFVVDLFQDWVGQADSVDAPPALRGYRRGSIVEVLVFGFKETVVDLVEFITVNLLWSVGAIRNGVRTEEDAILIFVEEFARCARLAAEFADACSHFDRHVWKAIHALANVG